MRVFKWGLVGAIFLAALFGLGVLGAGRGWWGQERDAGVIRGNRLPEAILAARKTPALPSGSARTDQILFGDIHVHTTWSTDAFQWSLPINGGNGYHPIADACDFARYCSSLDFWSITDHAESITPLRWQRTKEAIRQCQARAGDPANPDLVSYIGFEWSQVGRTPADHFGHKNVIFRDLEDDKVSARPIAARGLTTQVLRTQARGLPPGIILLDPMHAKDYLDFNTFIRKVQEVPDCDPNVSSSSLPANCYEQASTPGELVRRIDEQKLTPLIIPHGSSWGFYTPPGTSWDKALAPSEHPERFSLIEIYSGHGNSEEYRSWRDILYDAKTKTATCPAPTSVYLPSCWRAGEIIRARCQQEGLEARECESRAERARSAYASMGVPGHMAVPGTKPEEWLDSGQCDDCFQPPFNHRPQMSVQYGLAISRFDGSTAAPTRFRWGFVGSSDNHRARAGTGYKPVDRRQNTEAAGPINETLLQRFQGKPETPSSTPRLLTQDDLAKIIGFQLTEYERQASFFHTGGLVAVHAPARTREAIWDALKSRSVYATSGQKILLWFDHVNAENGQRTTMGQTLVTEKLPIFEVRALGSFAQKPGCPDFGPTGLDAMHLKQLCSGECYNPSDVRRMITRIEVTRIRPQINPAESVDGLIEDKFLVHQCPPSADGCTFRFSDPSYSESKRDTLYYVRAIQEPEPMINGDPLHCEQDASGKCIKVKLCYGDYRSGASECTAPVEPRAWSSPIYLDFPKNGG